MADFAHDLAAHKKIDALTKKIEGSGNGGNGGNDSMEKRVKAPEEAVKNLPTKTDFAELRADVKTGISDLRTEIHKNSIDLHRWMLGTVIGLFLGFGGLFMAMSNSLKQSTAPAPAPAVAPQQPIIINVPTAAPVAPAPSAPTPAQ